MNDTLIVFSPKNPTDKRTRFLVSKNQLHNYITQKNVKSALSRIENLKTNKTTLKFRKFGKLEIYLK